MLAWRVILTFALVFGLLPWGAYSGARAPGALASTSVAVDGSGPSASRSDQTARDTTLQAPVRRCQRTALVGGSCLPDLMPPRGTVELAPLPAVSSPYHLAGLLRLRDWTPPGALDPPRIG